MALRVCIIAEGSYPFITGGVSSWVHELINGLPHFEFMLLTLSPNPDQKLKYTLPSNVIEHKDIVISSHRESVSLPRTARKKLMQDIRRFHEEMQKNDVGSSAGIIDSIPLGCYLYEDAVREKTGWDMISTKNREKNPVYPFSEYFWSWKTAHDLIFTVLGSNLPDADVYHSVSTGYAGLAAVCAKIRKKKRIMITEHGLYHKEREMEIRRSRQIRGYQRDLWIHIYNNISRITYLHADRIIALFEYNRQLQVELGAQKVKTQVIPNGIDVEHFSSVKREKRSGFHIGLVGRVVPIKDIKTFIAMAKIVSEAIPDVHFYCIGPTDEDEGYYENCKLLVQSFKLSDIFEFTGRQDVRTYYAFLDVLVLTSLREAQPLVILEAFCAGVPVVATKVGNVPELLDFEDVFLSPPKDAEKLAAGVKYIYENPGKMATLCRYNREKVMKLYNRKDLFATYETMYRDLAGDGTWQG